MEAGLHATFPAAGMRGTVRSAADALEAAGAGVRFAVIVRVTPRP
jgi:hypothetical protein